MSGDSNARPAPHGQVLVVELANGSRLGPYEITDIQCGPDRIELTATRAPKAGNE